MQLSHLYLGMVKYAREVCGDQGKRKDDFGGFENRFFDFWRLISMHFQVELVHALFLATHQPLVPLSPLN